MSNLDFVKVTTNLTKNGTQVLPEFIIKRSHDLMIRGGNFYAFWNEEKGFWSTDQYECMDVIDKMVHDEIIRLQEKDKNGVYHPLYLSNASSGMANKWVKYCKVLMPEDTFKELDNRIVFENEETKKSDYLTHKLSYPLCEGDISAYNELLGTLYSDEERRKIEWAIGSIISGDSKKIQKFMVLYGSSGTGKGTVLKIIEQLFPGYYAVFDAKSLGSSSSQFSLEAFQDNPLIGIQEDGDLSHIEDNTKINSLVSHEQMTVNAKYKGIYSQKFNAFLFMGTNRPVKITDSRSGILRRLIDVTPTGNRIPKDHYMELMDQIPFELSGIAFHCKSVYEENKHLYDGYTPTRMFTASNDFYNFVIENFDSFSNPEGISLRAAWELYKEYCTDASVKYPMSMTAFREELINYFRDVLPEKRLNDGRHIRNVFVGFKFTEEKKEPKPKKNYTILFDQTASIFDGMMANAPAQYASKEGTPLRKWDSVHTTLSSIDTTRLHYVRVPINHIVIDFDIKDESGNKSYEKNLIAASKFPPTYAELSKSGEGIHLHYIYDGDPEMLDPNFDKNIEVKVFKGNSALRRKLTKCNSLPINHISSGLKLKEKKGDPVTSLEIIKTEKGIRNSILKALRREIWNNTAPSVSYIKHILDEAYDSGTTYDVSDLEKDVKLFAYSSSNQAPNCVKMYHEMHFKSKDVEEKSEIIDEDDIKDTRPLAFFDIEVFPNLFVLNYKKEGPDKTVIRMINPSSQDVESLITQYRLIGFNNRRYDNHIIYARAYGNIPVEGLYEMSQRIVNHDQKAFISAAYGISYTDIYDYYGKKDKSLKKWEIELNKLAAVAKKKMAEVDSKDQKSLENVAKELKVPVSLLTYWKETGYNDHTKHKELGLPWDQPVKEELWEQVAEYCDNDVITTEEVWLYTQPQFKAREILADIAGGNVNMSTNALTERIIGLEKTFNYRFLGDKPEGPSFTYKEAIEYALGKREKPEGKVWFPGYTFDTVNLMPEEVTPEVLEMLNLKQVPKKPINKKISKYRGEIIGEGGYVFARPGMYGRAQTEDSSSHHPHSEFAERFLGDKRSHRYEEIYNVRGSVKHEDYDTARTLFDGKLSKYLDDPSDAKNLSGALKIAINSVYGLTAASFDNPFRCPENVDNIIAKRGALTMVDIRHAVEEQHYTVIHCKTDSIKIKDPDDFIINFVRKMGEAYGYIFETEDKWDRLCLVNNAVFIGKTKDGEWKAVGKEFQVPYIYKTLFTKEPLTFDDYTVAFSVKKSALYIRKGDGYQFVGRVGEFVPVKEYYGGELLTHDLSDPDSKWNSASGAKGYYWLEAETVRGMIENMGIDMNTIIDFSYFEKMCDDAKNDLMVYGGYDTFMNATSEELNKDVIPFA